MPLLILVTPFFLVSTMLDLMHQKGGHRLVVAAAPLLVGGIWASSFPGFSAETVT
jgi:hypothetical protein